MGSRKTMEQDPVKKEKGMATPAVSMKLLIDSKAKKVLFAEAGKECVDFLFQILSLPVATIIRLLGEEGMQGSWPNLYKSLGDLDGTYIQSGKNKDTYLKPVAAVPSSSVPLLPLEGKMAAEGGGIVQGVVTYMVMDDLKVKPMSNISTIALLNDFNVQNFGVLEEKVVNLGMKEALEVLKASHHSKNVLTDVFC